MIAELEGVQLLKAESHYDHMVKYKQLPKLKSYGLTKTAQPTTTNRTAITTEKLLRTHNTQDLGKCVIFNLIVHGMAALPFQCMT